MVKNSFKINIPYYSRPLPEKPNISDKKGIPITIFYDEQLKLYRQEFVESTSTSLEEDYAEGSYLEGSLSVKSGQVYIPIMLDYLQRNFSFEKNKDVLEVGCGAGVFLQLLTGKHEGNFYGVEPSKTLVNDENIKVYRDFFPSKLFNKKVDLIYSFGVLEHIHDPLQSVLDHKNQLKEGGKLIFSVPNCEPYLAQGDPSILIHQHYSYFTRESVYALAKAAKLVVSSLEIHLGNIFFVLEEGNQIAKEGVPNSSLLFTDLVPNHLKDLESFINSSNEEDICIYCPTRALNSLFSLNKTRVRLVDDSPTLMGNFLPGLESKVESFEELLANPPQKLLIFSRTFENQIKSKCLKSPELQNTELYGLNDISHEN